MSNTIKYSEGSESLALNKGNWWIGTGDSNKGPTVESGYWNAINPPDGGYTVYLNKETNGPSIHSIVDDEKLISFTNKISGNNYTTVAECLVYYQTQDDKLCVNREIENIVTDGLVLNLDAGYVPSYPTSGTTWYDLSGNGNDGTLVNGTIFSGGSMVFDGVDDYVDCGNILNIGLNNISFGGWVKRTGGDGQGEWVFSKSYAGGGVGRYWLDFNDFNKLRVGIAWTAGHTNYLYNANISINTMYNYFVVIDRSSNLYLYLNGQLDSQFDISIYSNVNMVNGYPYRLGSYTANNQTSPSNFLNGNIYQHMQYNRALSATEVLQNYNAQKGRFGL